MVAALAWFNNVTRNISFRKIGERALETPWKAELNGAKVLETVSNTAFNTIKIKRYYIVCCCCFGAMVSRR